MSCRPERERATVGVGAPHTGRHRHVLRGWRRTGSRKFAPDLFLIHVQPFERRFTQGQAGGGGGGGGMGAMSRTPSPSVSAKSCWPRGICSGRRMTRRAARAERLGDNARMLSEVQGTLADQARTLVERAKARGVDNADPEEQGADRESRTGRGGHGSRRRRISAMSISPRRFRRSRRRFSICCARKRCTPIWSCSSGARNRAVVAAIRRAAIWRRCSSSRWISTRTSTRRSRRVRRTHSPEQLAEAIRKLRELARRQEQLARQQANQQQTPRESDRVAAGAAASRDRTVTQAAGTAGSAECSVARVAGTGARSKLRPERWPK